MAPGVFLIQVVTELGLTYQGARDTGLIYWGWMRSGLVSGSLVLCGTTEENDPLGLHFYTDQASRKVGSVTWCGHNDNINTECLKIGEKEMLAVSCIYCAKIWLCNLETGETSVAFEDEQHSPGQMCKGKPGQLIVLDQTHKQILFLDCAFHLFKLARRLPLNVEKYISNVSTCYIPGGLTLVISDHIGRVTAVSTITGEQRWEVTGQVQGKQCYLRGVVYSRKLDTLFLADGSNTRILELDPSDGSLIQILPLDETMGGIRDLCLHNDQLIVLQGGLSHSVKVSHFSIRKRE